MKVYKLDIGLAIAQQIEGVTYAGDMIDNNGRTEGVVFNANDFLKEETAEEWAENVVSAIDSFTDEEVDQIVDLFEDFNDSLN